MIKNKIVFLIIILTSFFNCLKSFSLESEHQQIISPESTALALENKYDVKYYRLDLEVNDSTTYIKGSTSILFKIKSESLDTLMLGLSDSLSVDSIKLNKLPVGYTHLKHQLKIVPFSPLRPNTLNTVIIYYKGFGPNNGAFLRNLYC